MATTTRGVIDIVQSNIALMKEAKPDLEDHFQLPVQGASKMLKDATLEDLLEATRFIGDLAVACVTQERYLKVRARELRRLQKRRKPPAGPSPKP
jgi:hypothetical protein